MTANPVVDQLKALGEPTRLELVIRLQSGEKSGTELLRELDLSQPSLSRHLKILRDARLVTERKHGRSVSYRLSESPLIEIVAALVARSNLREPGSDDRVPAAATSSDPDVPQG